jgi:hypothetical protein
MRQHVIVYAERETGLEVTDAWPARLRRTPWSLGHRR